MGKDSQTFKLYAYRIENEKLSSSVSDFTSNLIKKLDTEKLNAGQRRLKPSKQSNDEDVLSYYHINRATKRIFGIMMRIAPTEDVGKIPDNLFAQELISPDQLQAIEKTVGVSIICKNIYYFMVDEHHLVTTLPKNRMTQFKTYMNWLLEVYRGETIYKFSNLIEMPSSTTLKDIRSIVFADNAKQLLPDSKQHEEKTVTKLINVAGDFIKSYISDNSNLQFLIDKQILSANLVIKFNPVKKADADDDDVKKALSAILTPLADDEAVAVELRNRNKISAGQMIRFIEIEVEKMSNGAVNHEQLSQEMEDYLNSLKGVQR